MYRKTNNNTISLFSVFEGPGARFPVHCLCEHHPSQPHPDQCRASGSVCRGSDTIAVPQRDGSPGHDGSHHSWRSCGCPHPGHAPGAVLSAQVSSDKACSLRSCRNGQTRSPPTDVRDPRESKGTFNSPPFREKKAF